MDKATSKWSPLISAKFTLVDIPRLPGQQPEGGHTLGSPWERHSTPPPPPLPEEEENKDEEDEEEDEEPSFSRIFCFEQNLAKSGFHPVLEQTG